MVEHLPNTTATSTNTVASVNSAVSTPNAQAIQNKGDGAESSQSGSLHAATEVANLGGSQLASVGALFCAQGANKAIQDQPGAAEDIASCQSEFRAAREMQAAQQKLGHDGAFRPDPATMAQDGTKSTLDEFEKNFGVGPDEYMKKMLGSGGAGGTFSDLLSSKLSADKVDSLMSAAAGAPEQEGKFAVNLGGGPGEKRAPSSVLRDKLRQKLAQAGSSRATAPTPEPGPSHIAPPAKQLEDMTPLAGIFPQKEEPTELTIFGVVHNKYVQIRRLWGRR